MFIADDDPDDLEMLASGLKEISADTHIQVFPNGEELILHLQRTQPPISAQGFILDYSMPRLDGLAVLQWLKNSHYNHIPVFIFSTSTVEEHRDRCMAAGATKYLTKPTTYAELQFKIAEILRICEHSR